MNFQKNNSNTLPLFQESSKIQEILGYLELKLWEAAGNALQELSPQDKLLPEALILTVEFYRETYQLDLMKETSLRLITIQPNQARHWLNHAFALRHVDGIPPALYFLKHAIARFPENGQLLYALACHEVEMGEIERARSHFLSALYFEPQLRESMAMHAELSSFLKL